eukprot:Amastigsp_a841811_307.p1 type:complete len:368 gc:universal Amastigsp_a841811_307:2-1105(+)
MGTPVLSLTMLARTCAATMRSVAARAAVHTTAAAAAAKKQGNKFSVPKGEKAPRILVTGCLGQIGSELVPLLRATHGVDNVIASDVRRPSAELHKAGPWEYCDVANQEALNELAVKHNVDWIVHMASILSATGEQNPQLAIRVNAVGIQSVLEVARLQKLRVFAPSSIAAFGPSTPRDNTPNLPVMDPTTVYGVTKLHLELLGAYYKRKYDVDFRSVRYPGIISSDVEPTAGTTDYAPISFYAALRTNAYKCFLRPDSTLPMMMMDDALEGTMQLLHAPREQLKHTTYNINGISFNPEELFAAMNKFRPGFKVTYEPDFRQAIADSWPKSLDDSAARADWGWSPKYTMEPMVEAMFTRLSKRLGIKL